jgi:hypothetical protein
VILILIMVLMPGGVAGLLRRLTRTFTSALAKRENGPSPMPAVPARREET